MKLTCKDIGILLITWLCMSSSVKSQSSKSFVVSEPARLIDVLNELSTDNNILFAYPTLLINEIEIPKSEFKYEEIDDLIHLILNDFDFEVYNVTDSHFLIRKGVEKIASNQVITGSIKDAETGSPLSFATIYVPDYSYGVFSDAEGNFTLEIDNNNYDKFLVSYLGYKQLSVDVTTLMKNPHIRLNQNASIIEDVTIEYLIPPYLISKDGESVTLGKQVISSKTSGIFGNDILRNIQLLSGVSAVSDDMASLRIRGSNAEGSKIILDGIPLYNVSHYYGIFSSINGSFIQKAQLYKNAQPIQYNNTSGGLLILDSGFNNESKNVLDINFLTASIATDNKISDNARFQFAGRTSYRNVNDTKFINFQNNNTSNFSENNTDNQFVANDPLFRFYDLNASIKIRGEKSKISINGFLSNDRLINDYTQDYSIQDFMIGRYIYKNTEEWSNKGASLKYDYHLNQNIELKTSVYASHYDFTSSLFSELQLPQKERIISNANGTSIKELGASIAVDVKSNTRIITTGIELNNYSVTHDLVGDRDRTIVDYSDEISYATLFSQVEQKLGDLKIVAGGRLAMTEQKDKLKALFSPQATMSYKLDEGSSLKASYGYSNQILREIEYESRLGQNYTFYRLSKGKKFPILKTHKFMVGYNYETSGFGFDIEMYFKKIEGVMQLTNEQSGFDGNTNSPGFGMFELFKGERRVIGTDVTLSYKNKNYTSMLSYTLSKSEDRYPQIYKGNYFLSQDDRRHQINWINNWTIDDFEISANFIYASGRPYIALETLDDLRPKEILDPKENQNILIPYVRMDVGLQYNFKLGNHQANVGMSVYNLFNRDNVKFIQYSHKFDTNVMGNTRSIIVGTEGELLDRTVNLNFGLRF